MDLHLADFLFMESRFVQWSNLAVCPQLTPFQLNDLELNSPLARSTPNEEYRIPPPRVPTVTSTSSNYAPLHSIRPASMYGYQSPSSSTTVIPAPKGVASSSNNTSPRVNVTLGGALSSSRSHNSLSQEPAIVIRPVDLNMPKATPPASIRGAVPTAITQVWSTPFFFWSIFA